MSLGGSPRTKHDISIPCCILSRFISAWARQKAIARLGPRMERFISQENIKRFTEQHKHPANEQQRMLEQPLDGEEHHLADFEGRSHRRQYAQRTAVPRKIPHGRMTDTRMRIGAGLLVAVLSLLGIGQSVPATAGAAMVSYATR